MIKGDFLKNKDAKVQKNPKMARRKEPKKGQKPKMLTFCQFFALAQRLTS
jgi:hypothetical protein